MVAVLKKILFASLDKTSPIILYYYSMQVIIISLISVQQQLGQRAQQQRTQKRYWCITGKQIYVDKIVYKIYVLSYRGNISLSHFWRFLILFVQKVLYLFIYKNLHRENYLNKIYMDKIYLGKFLKDIGISTYLVMIYLL